MPKHNIMAHRVCIGDKRISKLITISVILLIIMTEVKCDLRSLVFYIIYTNSYKKK